MVALPFLGVGIPCAEPDREVVLRSRSGEGGLLLKDFQQDRAPALQPEAGRAEGANCIEKGWKQSLGGWRGENNYLDTIDLSDEDKTFSFTTSDPRKHALASDLPGGAR